MFARITSSHSKPRGDEGSVKALHISTTTRAGKSPIPVGCDTSVLKSYWFKNVGEAGASRCVSSKLFNLISSIVPPKLNISSATVSFDISTLSASVSFSFRKRSYLITTPYFLRLLQKLIFLTHLKLQQLDHA